MVARRFAAVDFAVGDIEDLRGRAAAIRRRLGPRRAESGDPPAPLLALIQTVRPDRLSHGSCPAVP